VVDRLRKRNVLVALAALIVVVVIAIAVAVSAGDDDEGATSTTTSSSSTTTSLAPLTTLPVSAEDIARSLYPDLSGAARFDDPVVLATAFATDFLAFDTDVAATFRDGGDGTGTVELRSHPRSDPTVVSLAQLPDQTWIVLGATTKSIVLRLPATGSTIRSPQAVAGAAYAFEGHVDVTLFADGSDTPIGNTFVTGRGDGVLGDFEGNLRFAPPDGARYGVLVLSSPNGEDGTSTAALAIRVAF
jgi:hypothetical protein